MKITIELNDVQDQDIIKDLLGIESPSQPMNPASPQESKPETTEEVKWIHDEKTETKKSEDTLPWEDEPKPITISDLRKKGTELTKAGKLPELQEVFAEFGAKKLSGLAEADYPAVMKRLEELK